MVQIVGFKVSLFHCFIMFQLNIEVTILLLLSSVTAVEVCDATEA